MESSYSTEKRTRPPAGVSFSWRSVWRGMNYYQFHIGDYASHTSHLDLMEDLAYRRLLDLYYRSQAPLPDDVQRIARLIRMADYAAIVRDILSEFFTRTPEGYRNTRADKEIAAYERMASGGAKGAAKRWAKGEDSQPMPPLSPPQADPNANHEPITINHEPRTKDSPAPSGLERRFEEFWKSYPRKVGKDAARKAFAKRKPDDALLSKMLATIRAQVQTPDWQKDGGQFIPHPATWLNQGRWEDVVEYRPADVARVTVPAKQGPDPTLQRLIEDGLKAVPPPPDVRQKLAALRVSTNGAPQKDGAE